MLANRTRSCIAKSDTRQGNEEPASYVVRHAGTRIVCHAENLDSEASDVLKGVQSLAGSVCHVVTTRDKRDVG